MFLRMTIKKTEEFVKKQLEDDATGHDYYHVDRVRKLAIHIAKTEKMGDLFMIEMAALLHDIPDDKLNQSVDDGMLKLETFLQTVPLSREQNDQIKNIILNISFKGGNEADLTTFEEKAVRDADRLDAIGAIGMSRAFAYGGKKGQPIYKPTIQTRNSMTFEEYRNGKSSSINHFYEKLLLLKDRLHTTTAKNIAHERHQFMEDFLKQFYKEWNGDYENHHS